MPFQMPAAPSLRTLHGSAAVLHAGLAIFIIVWASAQDAWRNGNAPLIRSSAAEADEDDMAFYKPVAKHVGDMPTVPLIAAMAVLTAVAHAAYTAGAGPDGFLTKWMAAGHNPGRFVEYAVTATIMTLVVAALSGVRDVGALTMLSVASVATMICGAAAEKSVANGQPWQPILWGVALLLFAATWGVIGAGFFTVLEDAEDEAPSWLPAIYWSQFALFCVFPIIAFLYARGKISFTVCERAYVGASLSAKAVLTILIASAFVAATVAET